MGVNCLRPGLAKGFAYIRQTVMVLEEDKDAVGVIYPPPP